ncbi:MAG: hypothetical protein PHQ00_04885, partial [Phycisphaerae bacterium]|nr:hypothetical protein [Phycisphaerae bacterium]
MGHNMRIINRFFFCTAVFLLIVAAGLAQAEPTMEITASNYTGNYDLDLYHSGDELLIQYEVTNTTPGSDQDYALSVFSVPAGINQGVYDVIAPDAGWDFTINPDNTTFTGETSMLSPGGSEGLFELYSTELNVSKRYATALSASNPPESFNPVEVNVPVERTLTTDLYFDGIVNFRDFAVLAGEWLDEEDWYSLPYSGDGPTMDIMSLASIGEYFGENPGNESKLSYLVTNTGLDDIDNSMITFIAPAGSNQGVYDYLTPDDNQGGWNVTIDLNETIFQANSGYAIPADGGFGQFDIFSTITDIGKDY